jgi:hypothetical protein
MKKKLLFCLISGILIPGFIFAQYSQQGAKLVGGNAIGISKQGSSIAISTDGTTALIGGLYDNTGTGAAWVFTRSNSTWSQQGQKLVGPGTNQYSYFGYSAAISADGNTAVVGSPGGNTGSAYVFIRNNGVWTQQGSTLVGSNSNGNPSEGRSVAISADGNTLAIGGHSDGDGVGAVWVFTRSNGVWTQQGDKLVGSGANGDSHQGISLAISADGNTLAEGGNYDEMSQGTGQGAVWVFTRNNGVWSQQGPKLRVGWVVYGSQGTSVAISADGNTIAEGGTTYNGSEGGVWIFTRTNNVWKTTGQWLLGYGDIGNINYPNWDPVLQGSSVAISADGNIVAEGGYGDNNWIGAVWVFTRTSDTVWSQDYAHSKLIGSGVTGTYSNQGISVAISGDGSTILAGGDGDNSGVGAAWVFFDPVLGIAENDIKSPSGFSIEQNYPNPFNSATTIKYKVTEPGFVSLKVVDVMGTEVASLVNEQKLKGDYSIVWDASGLESNVYFCKLQSGRSYVVKKMLLLK